GRQSMRPNDDTREPSGPYRTPPYSRARDVRRRSIVAPSKMGGGWVAARAGTRRGEVDIGGAGGAEVGGSWVPWVAAEYGVIGEISRGSSTAANALLNRSEQKVNKTVDKRKEETKRTANAREEGKNGERVMIV
ncbi:hypothetical protein ALC56_12388, partial [Trachymyrmex septentrionalis]